MRRLRLTLMERLHASKRSIASPLASFLGEHRTGSSCCSYDGSRFPHLHNGGPDTAASAQVPILVETGDTPHGESQGLLG